MTQPSAEDVIGKVIAEWSLRCGVNADQLLSRSRAKPVLAARHIAVYLAHRISGKTPEQIGARFGGRDYTNVLMYVRSIERRCASDEGFRALIRDMEHALGGMNGQPGTSR